MAATTATTKSATAAPLRKDPVRRHVDGSKGAMRLRNQDPSRVYVYAYRADQLTGEQYYADMGYQLEVWPGQSETDKVRPWGGQGIAGEPIEQRGHVLMSISKELHTQITQEGTDDCGGQAWVDAVEAKIVDRRAGGYGLDDGLRGISRKYNGDIFVENETSHAASPATMPGGF